jgi:hypothetical protein
VQMDIDQSRRQERDQYQPEPAALRPMHSGSMAQQRRETEATRRWPYIIDVKSFALMHNRA